MNDYKNMYNIVERTYELNKITKKILLTKYNILYENYKKQNEQIRDLTSEKNKLLEDYNKIKEEYNNLIKDDNEEKELNEFAITQNIELVQENSKLHSHIENVEKFLDNFNAIKKRKLTD
jgi:site-specific DNA-adenine methylase